MSLALDNDVRAEDEVVGLESVDSAAIVEDGEFPDLVGRWIVLKDTFVAEVGGITVRFTSHEFIT